MQLKIDGTVVINNGNSGTNLITNYTMSPGPHALELRLGQGSGAVGPGGGLTAIDLGLSLVLFLVTHVLLIAYGIGGHASAMPEEAKGHADAVAIGKQSGHFTGYFKANVAADMGLDNAKSPRYMLVTGTVDLRRAGTRKAGAEIARLQARVKPAHERVHVVNRNVQEIVQRA